MISGRFLGSQKFSGNFENKILYSFNVKLQPNMFNKVTLAHTAAGGFASPDRPKAGLPQGVETQGRQTLWHGPAGSYSRLPIPASGFGFLERNDHTS